ncbi:hypothetical protein GGQ99_005074 [Aminobacter niigataensis]|uniref:Uncharacterized protein n=1 Tax=Aminobacter niigataensis TaxID=83265 RepID=A0ABR6L907_9HYPH|nr:hypothetical protein [Aminobacter niigataensis]MBB4653289.1 hypothetical protein [Aminobacter niigataensis]
MANEKDKGQRRVYVLPNELVERIAAYQKDMGIQSEVEAARRLLDEALKSRDDWRSITRRFKEKLAETRVLSEIAKEVLVGHPLVSHIAFEPNMVRFTLTTGETVEVTGSGGVMATDNYNNQIEFDPKPVDYGQRKASRSLDDEIPF